MLQRKNGTNINPTYNNHVQYDEMVSATASDLRNESRSKVLNYNFISVLFDGVIDYRVRENKVLYVCHLENGQSVNRLISLSKVKRME